MAILDRLARGPVTGHAIDFSSLAALLDRSGSPLPLAELHGGLCGVICAQGPAAADGWLKTLIDDCAGNSEILAELEQRLQQLGAETVDALSGPSFEFAPLLPADDAVAERTEALALWCHGFLAGLIVGGVDLSELPGDLSAESGELVRDFAEISRAGPDANEIGDAEAGDRSLTELVEYVRVGAQLIFEELAGNSGSRLPRMIH